MTRGRKPIIETIGAVYGRLTVVAGPVGNPRHTTWECRCECGESRTVTGTNLRSGKISDCRKCSQNRRGKGRTYQVVKGQRFRNRTVTGEVEKVDIHVRVHTVCDCGHEKDEPLYALRRGLAGKCRVCKS